MCRSVSVLRLVAFLFLVVAFVACCIGFLAPFWVQRLPQNDLSATTADAASNTPPTPPSARTPSIPAMQGANESVAERQEEEEVVKEEEKKEEEEKEIAGNVTSDSDEDDRKFEGLWATCNRKFQCRCFAQNDFELEKTYPPWHKAAQGLFTSGLVFLLMTLVVGGFYLCCGCCRESFVVATILGAFSLIAFLPIALSVVIFGGFAYHTQNIQLTGGDENKFLWGYYVSIAGALVILVPALLYFLEGRRTIIVEHEDCETAKMV